MKKQQVIQSNDDEPLSLDMSFDEALEMLLNAPLPDDQNEEEQHQEEHKDDDCE